MGKVLLKLEMKTSIYWLTKEKKEKLKCDEPLPKKHCHNVDTKLHQLIQENLCGNELSDDHMTIASKLLKKAFPSFGGMQSTWLAQTYAFSPVLSCEESVQLHHTGQFHWVASALLKGKVYVFDSSFKGISSSMKVQLPYTKVCFNQKKVEKRPQMFNILVYVSKLAEKIVVFLQLHLLFMQVSNFCFSIMILMYFYYL